MCFSFFVSSALLHFSSSLRIRNLPITLWFSSNIVCLSVLCASLFFSYGILDFNPFCSQFYSYLVFLSILLAFLCVFLCVFRCAIQVPMSPGKENIKWWTWSDLSQRKCVLVFYFIHIYCLLRIQDWWVGRNIDSTYFFPLCSWPLLTYHNDFSLFNSRRFIFTVNLIFFSCFLFTC